MERNSISRLKNVKYLYFRRSLEGDDKCKNTRYKALDTFTSDVGDSVRDEFVADNTVRP